MSLQARLIRKGAEERVPFFSDKVIGPSVALRMLGDLQRDLIADVAAIDPAFLVGTVQVTGLATGTVLATDFALLDHTHILDVTAIHSDGRRESVALLPASYAELKPTRLSCYEVGGGLRFLGEESDWSVLTRVDVRIGLAGTASVYPTSDTATLLLPESSAGALIGALAVAFADRMLLSGTLGDTDVGPFISRLEQRAAQARQSFLSLVGRSGQGRTMPTVDAF